MKDPNQKRRSRSSMRRMMRSFNYSTLLFWCGEPISEKKYRFTTSSTPRAASARRIAGIAHNPPFPPLQSTDMIWWMKNNSSKERSGPKRLVRGAIASSSVRRGPSDAEIEKLCRTVSKIKLRHQLSVCCSLGLVEASQAVRLNEAGVDRLNHNLNTSARYYPQICTTHTYDDRVDTLRTARGAGLELCSGVIFGQGENTDDMIAACEALSDRSRPNPYRSTFSTPSAEHRSREGPC